MTIQRCEPDPSQTTPTTTASRTADGWPSIEKYLDTDGDGIEDGDESYLMARIPSTSAGAVLMLALVVGLAAAAAGTPSANVRVHRARILAWVGVR